MFPLLDESYFVGALFDPLEGHLDPSSVTNAYCLCHLRPSKGAEVYRHTWVNALRQPAGGWQRRHAGSGGCVRRAGWPKGIGVAVGTEHRRVGSDRFDLADVPR